MITNCVYLSNCHSAPREDYPPFFFFFKGGGEEGKKKLKAHVNFEFRHVKSRCRKSFYQNREYRCDETVRFGIDLALTDNRLLFSSHLGKLNSIFEGIGKSDRCRRARRTACSAQHIHFIRIVK